MKFSTDSVKLSESQTIKDNAIDPSTPRSDVTVTKSVENQPEPSIGKNTPEVAKPKEPSRVPVKAPPIKPTSKARPKSPRDARTDHNEWHRVSRSSIQPIELPEKMSKIN